MADDEETVVYAGAYDSLDEAKLDFQIIEDLHKEKWVGKYEAALFTKQEDGSVKIIDTDATSRGRGLKIGAIAGVALAVIFPPSILLGAVAGGATGLLAGHLTRGMKSGDIKELGELLGGGQAGIVFVGVATPEQGVERFLKHASKVLKKQVDADAEEIKRAIDEAVADQT
jgi:uncharacterized membrane protein